MSKWLQIARTAGQEPPCHVPLVPLVPKGRPKGANGTNGTIGTRQEGTTLPARIVLLAVPEGVPEAWGQGVADLLAMSPPGSISPERWGQLQESAYRLLRDWAAKARACGWNELDLFGCHPTRPLARNDCAGLVMFMDTWEVVSLDEDSAHLRSLSGTRLRFRPGMVGDEAVVVWEL